MVHAVHAAGATAPMSISSVLGSGSLGVGASLSQVTIPSRTTFIGVYPKADSRR